MSSCWMHILVSNHRPTGHCVKDHTSIFNGGYRSPIWILNKYETRPNWEFKVVMSTWLWFPPARVYLGEYKLYQNVEPLPRQKFAVDEVWSVINGLPKITLVRWFFTPSISLPRKQIGNQTMWPSPGQGDHSVHDSLLFIICTHFC